MKLGKTPKGSKAGFSTKVSGFTFTDLTLEIFFETVLENVTYAVYIFVSLFAET